MQITLNTTLTIQADSVPEAATKIGPVLEDINAYLSPDYELAVRENGGWG